MKTNTQIQKDVYDELKWDPRVSEAEVGVSVLDGVVTLSGYVPLYAEKLAAQEAAKRVAGVVAVVDDIKVTVMSAFKKDDQDIAKAAMNALEWHVWIPHKNIKFVVDDGWITLTGEVEWDYQRKAVESAVRYLSGVKGVLNNITLKPAIDTKDIKSKIEKAILRMAQEDIAKINVTASDSEVKLSGSVNSWAERSNAESAAWSAAGVVKVKNEIRIQPTY